MGASKSPAETWPLGLQDVCARRGGNPRHWKHVIRVLKSHLDSLLNAIGDRPLRESLKGLDQ